MTKIVTHIPPPINNHFDLYMLDPMLSIKTHVENVIIAKAKKKIRERDIGKKKQFDQLLFDFMETYERKKIEKNEYDAKIKEKTKKMRDFPTSGKTMCFERS
jgi:hypothetical protein